MEDANTEPYRLKKTFVSVLRAALKQGHLKFRDRERLDLSRKQMEYRFEKLAEDGLIEIHKESEDEHEHGGNPQRIAVLTNAGEAIIKDWLEDNPVDIQSVEAAGEQFVTRDYFLGELSEMGQRVNGNKKQVDEARFLAEDARDHSMLMEKFILYIAKQEGYKRDLIRIKMQQDAEDESA